MSALFTSIAVTEDPRHPEAPFSFGLIGEHRYWSPETFATPEAAMTLAGQRMAEMNAEYARRRAQLSQRTGRERAAPDATPGRRELRGMGDPQAPFGAP